MPSFFEVAPGADQKAILIPFDKIECVTIEMEKATDVANVSATVHLVSGDAIQLQGQPARDFVNSFRTRG